MSLSEKQDNKKVPWIMKLFVGFEERKNTVTETQRHAKTHVLNRMQESCISTPAECPLQFCPAHPSSVIYQVSLLTMLRRLILETHLRISCWPLGSSVISPGHVRP